MLRIALSILDLVRFMSSLLTSSVSLVLLVLVGAHTNSSLVKWVMNKSSVGESRSSLKSQRGRSRDLSKVDERGRNFEVTGMITLESIPLAWKGDQTE